MQSMLNLQRGDLLANGESRSLANYRSRGSAFFKLFPVNIRASTSFFLWEMS
jgi:hypothetical protein